MRRLEGPADRFDRRLVVGILGALLFAALVVARLVQVQVLEFVPLRKVAATQQERRLVLPAARGAVTDRSGKPLAITLPADRRRTHPGERLHPYGGLAAQVVGYVSRDGRGQEGIELAHDRDLQGVDGFRVVGANARGRLRSVPGGRMEAPRDGGKVVLTIDATAQSVLERELARTVEQTDAQGATGVLLDPLTGDVLAMASCPSFDPLRPGDSPAAHRKLRAVTDMHEPGSTFKAFTVAACLEAGLVEPETLVESSLTMELAGGHALHDKRDYGWVTVEETLVHSVNTATAQLGRKLGSQGLYEYARAFGFGCVTGIDVPGEVSGILRRPANWSGRSLETVAIGQELAVTPLQLACAYGAIANRGVLMKPRIVREIREPGGRTLREFRPRRVRRVVSTETARTLAAMLSRVVEEGTGETARIPGISVCGKTGTAQWFDPRAGRYDARSHVSAFAGFVPADEPRLVGVVMVERPAGVGWGREVAAPCFRRVVEGILLSGHQPAELVFASLGEEAD
jgi:cell division protein FtsI (penicillin-binding protein 3)